MISDTYFKKLFAKYDRWHEEHKAQMKEFAQQHKKQMKKHEVRMDRFEVLQDKTIATLTSMETYMHEELATKSELKEVKDTVLDHLDGFAHRQQKFDLELAALQSRNERTAT